MEDGGRRDSAKGAVSDGYVELFESRFLRKAVKVGRVGDDVGVIRCGFGNIVTRWLGTGG